MERGASAVEDCGEGVNGRDGQTILEGLSSLEAAAVWGRRCVSLPSLNFASRGGMELRLAAVATTSDEVQMAGAIIADEALGHAGKGRGCQSSLDGFTV